MDWVSSDAEEAGQEQDFARSNGLILYGAIARAQCNGTKHTPSECDHVCRHFDCAKQANKGSWADSDKAQDEFQKLREEGEMD